MYIILLYMLIVNLLTFSIYGIDKIKAKNKKWRISENKLLILCLVGGFIGAIFGVIFFSHKTLKKSFQIKFYIIILLWILFLFIYLIKFYNL